MGDGTNITRATPAFVAGTNRFVRIASGGDPDWAGHTLALERDGSVWSWGHNYYGQLGYSTGGQPGLVPAQVTGLAGLVEVSGGKAHSLALRADGSVWAWGYNGNGQLGNGTNINSTTPVQAVGLSNIVAVAAGSEHSMALRSDGVVFAWGYNGHGELGDGGNQARYLPGVVSNLTSVVKIAAGYQCSFAVKSDGTVASWGRNVYGSLGDGTTYNRNTPVTALAVTNIVDLSASHHVVALQADGSIWTWGYGYTGEIGNGPGNAEVTTPVRLASLTGAIDIATGPHHCSALTRDGTVWTWGQNGHYQLGRTGGLSDVPVAVAGVTGNTRTHSTGHSLFVAADGSVWSSGQNGCGELGLGNNGNRTSPAKVANLLHVRGVGIGAGHSVALKWDGSVSVWGWNVSGQLGLGSTVDTNVPVKMSSLTDVAGIAAGAMHTLAVRSNGTVFAWGLNDSGQLGDNTATNRNTPTAITNLSGIKAVVAGERHSLAMTTGGVVYAWGRNASGQLGDGTRTNRFSPVTATGLTNAAALAAGEGHSVVLKSNGTVVAFGDNRSGQLGDGTTVIRLTPTATASLSNVIAVAAGNAHSLALKSDGTVWAWGGNAHGQLGDGTTTLRSSPVQVTNITNAILIQAQGNSSLVVLASGEALVWGANGSGQLGTGGTLSFNTPSKGGFQYFETFAPYIKSAIASPANHRYSTWPMSDPAYVPWVVPLSGQQGVHLERLGSCASQFTNGTPWFVAAQDTSRFVLNSTNIITYTNGQSVISYMNLDEVDNVLAAFGSRSGGSPHYFENRYSYAVHCGLYETNTTSQVRIRVFRLPPLGGPQTNIVAVATNYFVVPIRTVHPSAWQLFASNQFTTNITSHGLKTRLQVVDGEDLNTWGASHAGQSRYENSQFVLEHVATTEAEGYGYIIEGYGTVFDGYWGQWRPFGARVSGGNYYADWVALYAVNFDRHPGLRSQFLDAPQFEGQPLPSSFIGKSVTELLTNLPPVTTSGNLTNQSYRTVNASPELFAHPVLDKLVTDLKRDPLALSAFVLNEIELTDPLGFGPGNNSTNPAIDYPGVSRNAVGVLRERQGSAVEQCALLIYLLRQAGYGAVYAFPTNRNIKMPDAQLSKLLRMQLRGAVDYRGILYTTESLIAVNYPWVVVDLGDGQRRHIFPWLKDTEVTEGLNLWDYMPAQYDSGYKWVKDYVLGKTNIMGLDSESDTVATLFPKFVDKHLRENWPGISLDDMGIRFRNRRHQISRWEDLPRPLVVDSPTNAVLVTDLASGTNSLSRLVNVFNTLQVQVRPRGQTNVLMNTGVLRLADIGSRKFLLFTNTTKLRLSLTPQHEGISITTTNGTNFPGGSLSMTNGQVLEITTPAQTNLDVVITRLREQYGGTNNTSFLPVGIIFTLSETRPFSLDNIAAVCSFPGRATPSMLLEQAELLWQVQNRRQSDTNYVPSLEDYHGSLVHLMGMKYCARVSALKQRLNELHKLNQVNAGLLGLAIFKQHGQGTINGILDMPFADDYFLNASARPDAGNATVRVRDNYNWLFIAGGSAEEHATIDDYLIGRDAISTVKLLQLAQKRSTGPSTDVIELYRHNYLNYESQIKAADSNSWIAITNAFAGLDSDMTRVLVTPGVVTNSTGDYGGVGTLIVQPFTQQALISGTYNGGVGPKLPNWLQTLLGISAEQRATHAARVQVAKIYARQVLSGLSMSQLPPDQKKAIEADIARILNAQIRMNMTTEAAIKAIENAGKFVYQNVPQLGGMVMDPVDVINGNFYVDAVDLTLPGPMPVTVRRNYSSHDLYASQFGASWKLNYVPYLIFNTNEDSSISIQAAEVDGATLNYVTNAPGALTNVWIATAQANPGSAHNNNEGGKSRNLLFGTRIEQVITNNQTYYYQQYPDGALKTYRVRNDFGLNGTSNSLPRIRPYLEKWQDNRGNSLSFTYGTNTNRADYGEIYRVESSSGMYLGFLYNNAGRVIEAYTGDGRRLYYEYDEYGDLIMVTLPDASQIRYEYQHYPFTYTTTNGSVITTNLATGSEHLLVREVKPDGRLLVNEYDAERRVVRQHATAGQDLRLIHNATFIYANNCTNLFSTNAFTNSIFGTTLVIDVFGNTNRYEYTNGLLTRITDPLGFSLIQDWYWTNTTAGSYTKALKSKTDKRGLTTTFLYDTNGNVVTNIVSGADLTGNGATNAVITSTYTNGNVLLSQTDAVGSTVWMRYGDTNYPKLPTHVERYAAGGAAIATNRLSYTNATTVFTNGGTIYTNKSFGLLAKEITAWGSSDEATTDYSYDGRGFVTQKLRYTGTADPNVTNFFAYNDRGELVEQRDAAGRKTRLAYDPRGNPEYTEKFDENGNRLYWEYAYYNENGELTWSDGPRFDPEDYVWRDYDGAGRKTQEIRWRSRAKANGTGVEAEEGYSLYATTFSEYDAFGNLLRVIDPYGNYDRMTYDANGQMRSKSRYAVSNAVPLATEWFGYEGGGLLAAHTNALGGVTLKSYTSTGKLKRQENPDGSTNGMVYRLDGRLATNYLTSGAYWETQYDDANRRVTNTFRTAAGTYLAREISEYDRRGNLIRKTDAGTNVFTTSYDGLNRVKTSAGPGGTAFSGQQTNTVYYDAAGISTTNKNGLGELAISKTDALGRPIRSEVWDATGYLLRVNKTSYATNHHSVTTTVGEMSTNGIVPIPTTTYTDTFGQPVLNVFADGKFTLNRYDMAGNLVSSQDELAQVTQFAYDPFYRVQRRTTPDGAFVTFAYNAGGSLTNRTMPGGLVWSAGYDAAGRMVSEVLNGGGLTTRNFSFSYFGSGHTNAGLLQTVTDPLNVTHTSSYDGFLRTAARVSTGTNGTPQNQTNTFTYDVLGRVLALEQGTGTGAVTRVERGYDGYGQVTNETVKVAGTNFSQFTQAWTVAGRRSALTSLLGGTGGAAAFTHYGDGLLASVTRGGVLNVYDYDDRGLMLSRTNEWRRWQVGGRDARGRPTNEVITVAGVTALTESLAWRDNSTLSAYGATRAGLGAWNETNQFAYNNRGQLTQETFHPRTGLNATNAFGFPAGTNNQGVRTTATLTGGVTASWSGTTDGLGRVKTESVGALTKWLTQARGYAVGAEAVRAWLDNTELTGVMFGSVPSNGLWLADLTLTNAGSHTVRATAYHPLSRTNASTTNTFTVVDASGSVTNTYDAAGNVVGRSLPGGRIQALTWDGGGRLVSATERDASNNGWNWSALYDGLGRRLRTVHTPVVGGSPSGTTTTTDAWFDPQVEFLEVAVGVNGNRTWAIHGPDLSGRYGGAQGIGGLEGTIRESDGTKRGAVSDHFGNVVASIAGLELAWNGTRVTGYGPVAGQPVPWLGAGKELVEVSVWRSRRLDPTGFYWLGARYYEPGSGRFLSADPFGHEASMSLYDYANGDPVNYLDPDGRLRTGFDRGLTDGPLRDGDSSALTVGHFLGGMFADVGAGANVTMNAFTFGATDKWGLTQSDDYREGVYDISRTAGTIGGVSAALAAIIYAGPAMVSAAAEAAPGAYVMAANAANNPVVQTVGFSMLAAYLGMQNQGLSADQQLGGIMVAGLIGRGMAGPSKPSVYSVAFETQLAKSQRGLSDQQHYQIANRALQAERAVNQPLAQLVPDPVKWGRPPTGWTWQHATTGQTATIGQPNGREGVLQLVPRWQHTAGSPFWPLFHPLPHGAGGYKEWAEPAGAPRR